MWNRVKWVLAIALIPIALGQAGCNLDKTQRPDLAGPSELAASLGMSANPDQLTANGNSSSVIEATLRGPDGNPAANVNIVFDLRAFGASNFSDIGVLAPVGGPRPVPGGPRRPQTVTAETNGNGVARARYWSPFRTDQENDITITVTGRPEGNDFRDAVSRQVDIFLRAANRPNFPGETACSFIVEPVQTTYARDQLIFFTATQISGGTEPIFPIARYEWDFGDGDVGPTERNVSHAFESNGTFTVTLTTTEAQSGDVESCTTAIVVTSTGDPPPPDPGPPTTCPAPSASFAASQVCTATTILADDMNETLFNGSASTAGTGQAIVSYRWNFGDGDTGSGRTTSHVYPMSLATADLDVSVVLTVVNDCGATASTSTTFDVVDVCP